jgi:hypothetical protein
MRYELTDLEWVAIKSPLPNKPRGIPPSPGSLARSDLSPPGRGELRCGKRSIQSQIIRF